MTWPFNKPEVDPANANPDKPPENKPPEKSPAELMAESLKPFNDTLAKIGERLDAIEANTVKKPDPPKPAELTSVLDDENVAFAQRLTPIMLRQLELEARVVRDQIRGEYAKSGYGDLWDQFEQDIIQVLDGTPVVNGNGAVLRGDPTYIRNVVDMVFGRNARKAGMRFDGKSKGFFLESASGSDGAPKPPENDGLTDGQRKVFARMKVPVDDAKKVMAKLKFVS